MVTSKNGFIMFTFVTLAEEQVHVGPHYPALIGAVGWLLPFLDFDHLIREQAMRFAVYRDGCLFAGSFNEAKDFPCAFIEPVLQVFRAMLVLSLKVFRMGTRNGLSRQSVHMLVNIQIELVHSRGLLYRESCLGAGG